ncbi:MAG: alcohol dehydrogenase [Acidiferrobacteraceae bacterium]|nr:alcohol dehydrogenase [Acidiferrobacteraceae bacterium]
MTTSKIIQFYRTGPPEVLQIDDCLDQKPLPTEVNISIKAFGLNRAECMLRQGVYAFDPIFPCRLGGEGSGTIAAIGSDIVDYSLGQKVAVIPFALADEFGYWKNETGKYGCYGESVTVPVEAVVRVPDNITSTQSAASWMQYLTAWGGLIHNASLTNNDTVLITAGSSSAALGGIQLSKDSGATVIATTRSKDKIDRLKDVGADYALNSENDDFVSAVMDITNGKGVSVIYDPVSGATSNNLLDIAAPEARIVCYGNLNSQNVSFTALAALTKRISIKFYSLYDVTRRPTLLEKAHQYVYARLSNGIFVPIIDSIFQGLEKSVDAHKRMESNQQFGKIVVEV